MGCYMSIVDKFSSRLGKREAGPNIEVARLCVEKVMESLM